MFNALFDGVFVGLENQGDVAHRHVVDVEEDERALLLVEAVDELVEAFQQLVLLGVGYGVEHAVVERHKAWHPALGALPHEGGVDGHAVEPCGGLAVAAEAGEGLP